MQAKLIIKLKKQLFEKIYISNNRWVSVSFYLSINYTINITVILKILIFKLVNLDNNIDNISLLIFYQLNLLGF